MFKAQSHILMGLLHYRFMKITEGLLNFQFIYGFLRIQEPAGSYGI